MSLVLHCHMVPKAVVPNIIEMKEFVHAGVKNLLHFKICFRKNGRQELIFEFQRIFWALLCRFRCLDNFYGAIHLEAA